MPEVWETLTRDASVSILRWNDTILGVICMVTLLLLRYFRAAKINEETSCLPGSLTKVINTIWFTVVTTRNVIVVLITGGLAAVLDAQGRRPFALTDAVKGGLPPIRIPDFSYTYNDTETHEITTVTFTEILSVSLTASVSQSRICSEADPGIER